MGDYSTDIYWIMLLCYDHMHSPLCSFEASVIVKSSQPVTSGPLQMTQLTFSAAPLLTSSELQEVLTITQTPAPCSPAQPLLMIVSRPGMPFPMSLLTGAISVLWGTFPKAPSPRICLWSSSLYPWWPLPYSAVYGSRLLSVSPVSAGDGISSAL